MALILISLQTSEDPLAPASFVLSSLMVHVPMDA